MTTLDEIRAMLTSVEEYALPKAVIVPDAESVERPHKAFPRSELAGMKIFINPAIPPDTAYILADTPKLKRTERLPFWELLPLNPMSIVKIDNCS